MISSAAWRAALAPGGAKTALSELLSARFGSDDVRLTASGTEALQMALTEAGARAASKGRPVALPAYTCYDVASAAVGAHLPVTFYDIDPRSLCPDLEGIRRCLSAGAGILVANSLFGFPLDWDALREECDAAGAILIEDCAQGIGSTWRGRAGGSFGDMTVLSFGRGKGWTGGGGGALLVRSGAKAASGDRWASTESDLGPAGAGAGPRALSACLAQWAMGRPSLFWLPASLPGLNLGETHYRAPTPPHRMDAFAAASVLGHESLARAEVETRRLNGRRWGQELSGLFADPVGWFAPTPLHDGTCGYLRYPVVVRSPAVAAALGGKRGRRAGIGRGYPTVLPELPALGPLIAGRPTAAGASELAEGLFTLPTHGFVGAPDFRAGALLLQGR
ncbi:MAG TPA: DegT/DnrJ/EryC1/StrS family aminotransferase [Longimicrobiales bacterium]|nr:DegT/DnrJ/EryC1/StrS family aminotransferase [Longimicrobiales bacterium]